MYYYLLLTAATIALCILGMMLWRQTRSIAFPFGLAALYFWTLYGAWSIVTDLLGGDSGKHYYYLYDKMFPVDLDSDYFWTLGLYAAFLVIIAVVALCFVRPARLPTVNLTPIVLSHDGIILACGIAALASLWIIHFDLEEAAHLGMSAYRVTRGGTTSVGSACIRC